MPTVPRGRRAERRHMQALRRSCGLRLEALGLPPTYDLTTLLNHLTAVRGRPILLLAAPMCATGPCGLWLPLPDTDCILYEEQTSRHHQEHIIAHELSHIVCGHQGSGTLEPAAMEQLFPDLDPSLVKDLLFRKDYGDAQEQEAELMAYLLGERLRATPERTNALPFPETVLDRISRSFGRSHGD
ncbi:MULTISPECIES: toxin [Streptomyces]|uniref:Toxin n=1 Tax=Streptomyces ramulosus TaxID=47762 RepID=A0ABW1FEL9_9ACTN